ncbi:MAG: 50S ribosomal protein L9 [Candidatus Omnitrophica bacterium CG07_land_8_20_14_0_80_42_15]|uniref:Large ribosomal subunit protein bL9 n=1 Tax=Candidatus Aquitaenariimonas noxiae TaxID=1974741 RepID=A0A2J0L0T1_9BACT|nr:MAG: 50S ribosomal protein L9 [Candidatus Omnitrophica bacterium CG07_land_8_20_14_0_80_42_15]
MKVILIKDIENLGVVGDVINVSDGYARNFLIPRGYAKNATPSNLKTVEEEKRKALRLKEKEKEGILLLAEKISNSSFTIPMRAGEEDKLFGAVTTEMIAKACEAEGIKVDKHNIQIDEPIKKLGVYQVKIKLHPEVNATLKLWVVKE